ncbi:MAG: twitching motility protein PilI [Pseudomonadota bacterium]|nr:twitching motility protein PilI [Pseudomonadota bacterium]
MSERTVRTEKTSARTAVSPSEALNRFEPPEGFVPVATETVKKQLRYGFRSGGLSLLIQGGVGSEVVPMMPLAAIPNGPGWLQGVINLRGNLVPVCDLAQMLSDAPDAPDVAARKTMILVLDKGDKAAGFVIDGHPVALNDLRLTNQVPELPEFLANYVRAAHSTDEEVWLEFDHEGFLLGGAQ